MASNELPTEKQILLINNIIKEMYPGKDLESFNIKSRNDARKFIYTNVFTYRDIKEQKKEAKKNEKKQK